MNKTVFIIAAHPDDEILGVGGTIRRHVLAGDTVHALVICEGISLRYQGQNVPQAEHGLRAAEILGFSSFEMLNLPDQHLDTMSLVDIITPIEERVRRLRPQIVYTHFGGDINRDHQLVFEAVMVACRPIEGYIEAIYSFETPSATEWNAPMRFLPNYFVDISATLEDKLRAFACYESEVREYPHPRSLESLRHRAHYWGNLVNISTAEAFFSWRRIWKDPENGKASHY